MILLSLSLILAKRYLLTDNIVKLKDFQHKKVAVACNLPGTKGNQVYFITSFIDLSLNFSLSLSLFSLFFSDLISQKKLRWFILSFLVCPRMPLSPHSVTAESTALLFSLLPGPQRNTKTSAATSLLDQCHSKWGSRISSKWEVYRNAKYWAPDNLSAK